MVYVADNVMVGELCFKGEADKNGAVEIGYGTYQNFQNKGFMTEALQAIVKWALEQKDIKIIVAKTDPTNIASQRILIKNNFSKISETKMIE